MFFTVVQLQQAPRAAGPALSQAARPIIPALPVITGERLGRPGAAGRTGIIIICGLTFFFKSQVEKLNF